MPNEWSELLESCNQQQRRELDKILFPPLHPAKKLTDFVKSAWGVIEPGTQLEWNWHLDTICEHLEAVTRGKIKRLIINVPPRSLKSVIISKCWPAWAWLQKPEIRWIFASNDNDLALEFAVNSRDIISSSWYQTHWGNRFRLVTDNNIKSYFKNNKQGYRRSQSIYSKVTGKGANIIVIDDPHDVKDADSLLKLQAAIKGYKALVTRLNDRRKDAIVLIQQRVCEDDLTGYLLKEEQGQWEVLCLPMEYEPPRFFTSLWDPNNPYDKRSEQGELLFGVRFTQAVLNQIKQSLQSVYSAQYQQRPTPTEGVLFNINHFKNIDQEEIDRLILNGELETHRHWDLAATLPKAGNRPAFTAGVKLGLHKKDRRIFVLDVKRERLDPAGVENLLFSTAVSDGTETSITTEEEKGSAGKHVSFQYATKIFQGFNYGGQPIKGDKLTRAKAFAAQVKAGNVYVNKNSLWWFDYSEEMKAWPRSPHLDQGDASSGAFNELVFGSHQKPQVKSDSIPEAQPF